MFEKKPICTFISLYVLLILSCLNYLYAGVTIWWINLHLFMFVTSVLIAISILIYAIFSVGKTKILSAISIILSLVIVMFLLVNVFFAQLDHKDTVVFSQDMAVQVYFLPYDDQYLFVQKQKVLSFFSVERCVYSKYLFDVLSWEKDGDTRLLIYDQRGGSEYLDFSDSIGDISRCSCKNNPEFDTCVMKNIPGVLYDVLMLFSSETQN